METDLKLHQSSRFELRNCWLFELKLIPLVLFENTDIFCRDLGLDLFRENVLSLAHVRDRCVTGLIEQFKRERAGDTINRTLVRNLLSMLSDLQVELSCSLQVSAGLFVLLVCCEEKDYSTKSQLSAK